MDDKEIGFCRKCGIMVGSRLFCETSPCCTNCNYGFISPQTLIWGLFTETDFFTLINELEIGEDRDFTDGLWDNSSEGTLG